MNAIIKNTIISTKSHYEVRKSNNPTGPAIKKFAEWEKAYDYVWSLCDVTKPEYNNPGDYVIVEVKTTVEVSNVF